VSVIVHRSKEGSPANGPRAPRRRTARSQQAGNGVATSLIPALDQFDHFMQLLDLLSFSFELLEAARPSDRPALSERP
jgi:hypothetical protein